MLEKRDSYAVFCKRFKIDKNELFSFGIEETIWPPVEKIAQQWENLKERIFNNQVVTIRGYGRDGKNTNLYVDLYRHLFNNSNVVKDPTHNAKPRKMLSSLTGYTVNVNLVNYQASHIFGKANNCFLFESPWNIVFVPKIVDPFTGHESQGNWPKEYQKLFRNCAIRKYADFIGEYNKLITQPSIAAGIKDFVDNLKKQKGDPKASLRFEKDVLSELSPIAVE